jgi:hypothetical protein
MADDKDPAMEAAQEQQREAGDESDTDEQFSDAAKDATLDNVSDVLGLDDK